MSEFCCSLCGSRSSCTHMAASATGFCNGMGKHQLDGLGRPSLPPLRADWADKGYCPGYVSFEARRPCVCSCHEMLITQTDLDAVTSKLMAIATDLAAEPVPTPDPWVIIGEAWELCRRTDAQGVRKYLGRFLSEHPVALPKAGDSDYELYR